MSPRRRMSRGLPVVAFVLALVSACASTGSPGATGTGSTGAPVTTAASTTSPTRPGTLPGESAGAYVFRTQCAGCHGTKGEGNLGPSLEGVAGRLSVDEQLAIVRGGKGRMPSFSPGLTDDEITAVVAYTRTHLPADRP